MADQCIDINLSVITKMYWFNLSWFNDYLIAIYMIDLIGSHKTMLSENKK